MSKYTVTVGGHQFKHPSNELAAERKLAILLILVSKVD